MNDQTTTIDIRNFMTPAEVGERIGKSLVTLYHWRAQGKHLRCYQVGRRYYYDPADVQAYQDRNFLKFARVKEVK